MTKKTPQLIDFFNGGVSPFASKAPVPQTGMNLRAGPLNNGNKYPVPSMNSGSLASILNSPNPNMSVGTSSKKPFPAKPLVMAPSSPSMSRPSPLNPVAQTTSNNADLASLQQKLQGGAGASPLFTPQQNEIQDESILQEWINPKGGFYTPDEVAENRLKNMPQQPEGDINRYIGQEYENPDMTADQLKEQMKLLNNARNDIAVGETDPYGLIDADLQFSPAEIQAIRSAQAGIYDPAITSAQVKLEARQQRDASNEQSAQRMRELQFQAENDQNAPYTLSKDQVRYDGQGNPIAVGMSDESTVPTTYTPGQDSVADSWVKNIQTGQAGIKDVPDEYKSAVNQGLATTLPPVSKTAKKLSGVISKILEYDEDELDDISGFWKVPTSVFGVNIDGTTGAKIRTLTKQLQGTLAIKDRSQFNGQGAISDFEFRVLQQAASDLGINDKGGTSLPVKDFIQRITDMKTLLDVGDTGMADDRVLQLKSQGATPEQIREIARDESFSDVGNTTASKTSLNRPQRNNNPGNVKKGGLADSLAVGTDDQGHLVFKDANDGWKALVMDVTAKVNGASRHLPPNPTIAQLGKVYAEDPRWATSVSKILGVSPGTPTKTIPLTKLAQAIATQEGFFA